MDWDDIRILVQVGRANSFSAAAEALGSSKASISRRIAVLEQMAGRPLFRRTPHGTVLLPEAERIVARALRIERDILDLEQDLRDLGTDPGRLITIRVTEGVASYLLTPIVAGHALGPLARTAARDQLQLPPVRLVPYESAGGTDIDLLWTPQRAIPEGNPSDKIRKLAEFTFVPFISGRYRPDCHSPSTFAELASHPLLTHDSYVWFPDDGWTDWRRLLERTPQQTSVAWTSSLGHLILAGAGVGLLPTYSVQYSDELKRLDVAVPQMVASLWMRCREDAYADPHVRKCADTLYRLFAGAEW